MPARSKAITPAHTPDDVNGKQMVASMDLNYSIHPHRPAGGVWTSAHDLIRYVQLELAKGKLPNGKVLVSETNLLARRKPYVKVGAYGSYGMGLQVDNRWGTPVVSHGGSMLGFKSDIMFLPEHGVGAVILTNADTGGLMLGSFRRRFLEVLFDGKPEAAEDLAKAAENYKAVQAKFRERLVVPAEHGGRGETGCSLHESRAGRACRSPRRALHRVRSGRVAQLSGFAQERRRHNLLHDDRSGRQPALSLWKANATRSELSSCARANTNTSSRNRHSADMRYMRSCESIEQYDLVAGTNRSLN